MLSWATALTVASLYLTYILYHTLWYLSRGFGKIFQKFLSFRSRVLFELTCTVPSSLDIYIIPHFSVFVKRFLKIFQKTFSRLTAHTYCASLIARLLTLILYHKNTHLSIWQNAQTFAHDEMEICAKRRRRPGDDPGRPSYMNKCSYVHTNKKPCIRARL